MFKKENSRNKFYNEANSLSMFSVKVTFSEHAANRCYNWP